LFRIYDWEVDKGYDNLGAGLRLRQGRRVVNVS
jgi:hypothetical protein